MEWKKLTSEAQWSEILERSYQKPQVIYKHSPRCSISSVVKSRLERGDRGADVDFYFLDVIADRGLSRAIAEGMHVVHESPQVLLIRKGACVYNESHGAIMMDEIVEKSSA